MIFIHPCRRIFRLGVVVVRSLILDRESYRHTTSGELCWEAPDRCGSHNEASCLEFFINPPFSVSFLVSWTMSCRLPPIFLGWTYAPCQAHPPLSLVYWGFGPNTLPVLFVDRTEKVVWLSRGASHSPDASSFGIHRDEQPFPRRGLSAFQNISLTGTPCLILDVPGPWHRY